MTTYTIKGLYIGRIGEEKNPTYFGTLQGAISYAESSNFTYYGEDIKICIGDYVVAIQKAIKKVDEIGEYTEHENWKVRKNGKFVEYNG